MTWSRHPRRTGPGFELAGLGRRNAVRRVLVQGGGIGGLTLAAALAQRNVEVDVVEARAGAGAGIGLHVPANALGALDETGVRDAVVGAGWVFEDLHLWDLTGRLVARLPPSPSVDGRPANVAISRPLYGRILRHAAEAAGARVHVGVTIADLVSEPDGVEVGLAPYQGRAAALVGAGGVGQSSSPQAAGTVRIPPIGSTPTGAGRARYDLVVGFDGIRSPLRERMLGAGYGPTYTGVAVWRAALPRHPAVERVVMCQSPGAKVVLTPISADAMYVAVLTPEPGNPRQDPDRLAELLRTRLAAFTGPVGELRDQLGASTPIAYTPLEQVTIELPWYRGRVVIGGDAAHASTPYLAQGGAMAVEDAVVLAGALTRNRSLPAALGTWYQRRRPRAMFVQEMSRALLAQELGRRPTARDDELLALGVHGAQARLADPY